MQEILEFIGRYGYAVLFGFVLGEQIGLPIPAAAILLAAGALAGFGELSLTLVILLATAAAVSGDLLWYGLGRVRGRAVLNLVCRVSLEPDSCVRRAQDALCRHGSRLLLAAKFVPGLSTVAPPLYAVFGMSVTRFLVWDAAGSLLWVGAWSGAGYLFRMQLEDVARYAGNFIAWTVALLGAALALYVSARYYQRKRFILRLRTARITPEELLEKLGDGSRVMVVDLRHELDREAAPVKIPGAVAMLPGELSRRHQEIPRDCDAVLYCSCPNEATSAYLALQLQRFGISRVRPLGEGFEGWLARGFPTEPIESPPSIDL